MLDNILAIGASFDWITPCVDLYKDLKYNHHDFIVGRYSDWSVGKTQRLLKSNGITTWGIEYTADTFSLRLREEDVAEAQRVLIASGVPLIGGLVELPEDTEPEDKPNWALRVLVDMLK